MDTLRPLTLDSNVIISQIKGDEEYSQDCERLISRVGKEYYLVEPSILFAEVGNAVGRNIGIEEARRGIDLILKMVGVAVPCDQDLCVRAGLTGAECGIYSADSLYLQTAIDFGSTLVSLDLEFLDKIKTSFTLDARHVHDLRVNEEP